VKCGWLAQLHAAVPGHGERNDHRHRPVRIVRRGTARTKHSDRLMRGWSEFFQSRADLKTTAKDFFDMFGVPHGSALHSSVWAQAVSVLSVLESLRITA
jgi:hypothetical protein